jgi:hypothetical protein
MYPNKESMTHAPGTELVPRGYFVEAAIASAGSVDYGKMIGDNSVLLAREWHDNTSVRQHLTKQAPAIAEQGITHYAIEAPPNPILDGLNASNADTYDLTDVRLGPWGEVDPGYEKAVRAMAKAGIKVVPVGADTSDISLGPKREMDMTHAVEAILTDQPDAKILCLMGGEHGMPSRAANDPVLLTRLRNDGVSVATMEHFGGVNQQSSIQGYAPDFLAAVAKSGRSDKEFMLDVKRNPHLAGVLGADAPDFAVHLPPAERALPDIVGIMAGIVALGQELERNKV